MMPPMNQNIGGGLGNMQMPAPGMNPGLSSMNNNSPMPN
jgi:hypothetical protein